MYIYIWCRIRLKPYIKSFCGQKSYPGDRVEEYSSTLYMPSKVLQSVGVIRMYGTIYDRLSFYRPFETKIVEIFNLPV